MKNDKDMTGWKLLAILIMFFAILAFISWGSIYYWDHFSAPKEEKKNAQEPAHMIKGYLYCGVMGVQPIKITYSSASTTEEKRPECK